MTKEEINEKIASLQGENLQEELNLRGKLVNEIKKEVKQEKDKNKKALLEAELIKAIEQHKKTILKLEKEQGKAISIPKRVGLKVTEIADTIKIFMKKQDILGKLKTAGVSTAACTIFMASISAGLAGIAGTLSLATLTSLFPSICYVALSNVIRMGFTDTQKSKIIKILTEGNEVAKVTHGFVKENILENNEFLEHLKEYKNFDQNTNDEKIEKCRALIANYREIIQKAPNDEIKSSLDLELAGVLTDLRKCLNVKKKNYIDDQEKLSAVEFVKLEAEIASTSAEIYKITNKVNLVTKETTKNIGKSAVSMYASRALLLGIFPQLGFQNLTSAMMPMVYTVISNLAATDQLKDKIKIAKSNYVEQVITFNNKELADEIFGSIRSTKQVTM